MKALLFIIAAPLLAGGGIALGATVGATQLAAEGYQTAHCLLMMPLPVGPTLTLALLCGGFRLLMID